MTLVRERPKRREDGGRYLSFWCPGCRHSHTIIVGGNAGWTFNEDKNEPTFYPSVRSFYPADTERGKPEETLCHFFVERGKIRYLSDCVHPLAGQVTAMVEFPDDYNTGDAV